MNFIYGKNDWHTMERGQENCYLLTNGLGGFSSGTIIGSNSRNDHALLMACVTAPNNRIHMITKLEELLIKGDCTYDLTSQEYVDSKRNRMGFAYQSSFAFEILPQWCYQADGVEIVKKIALKPMENTLAVEYTIYNYTDKLVELSIKPCLQFVKKGLKLEKSQTFEVNLTNVSSNGLTLYYKTNGTVTLFPTEYEDSLYYSYDACDGRDEVGCAAFNHRIDCRVYAKERQVYSIVYSTDPITDSPDEIFQKTIDYNQALIAQGGIHSPLGKQLVQSANQFVVKRESTNGKSIIAGYPFFEDWGRDTMIAVTGCCIATRQFEDAKSIVRTFMNYCKNGLMPNLFPEGGNPPMYNTVDASLLFINAVYEYYLETKEEEFVKEAYPIMEDIISWYQKGTDFGIGMDGDGLIKAGKGYDQVTWMDVRINEILPTPRHGKPVEINAYWYNCLRIMETFSKLFHLEEAVYGQLAKKVKQSFCDQFWNRELGCLRDVVSGQKADNQIRCNQIWAVSLPFTMLSKEQEKQVVDLVFEKLYTPYGLRTLAMEDPQFQPFYGGVQLKRDLAYHQGTVWTFPLGAYYLAYLKVYQENTDCIAVVKRQLGMLEAALREGCVGQLPELYDGEILSRSKGCFAQAWSVAELLRVSKAVDNK